MRTSENLERLIIAASTACSATAAYIIASPLPEDIKILVVPILGSIGIGLGAFWAKWINPRGEIR